MQRQPLVLIISRQPAMQHLAEQVCRRAGGRTVTAASGPEATAIVAQRGLHDFALVVMDTADPGQSTLSSPRMARQLLREWTAASPILPFVFIGPPAHKHALLKIRADIVRFVTPPFGLHGLTKAVESCLPRPTQLARYFTDAFSNPGPSNDYYHHGPRYPRVSQRESSVRLGVAGGSFSYGRVPHTIGDRGPYCE